jgi:hypothetical protein
MALAEPTTEMAIICTTYFFTCFAEKSACRSTLGLIKYKKERKKYIGGGGGAISQLSAPYNNKMLYLPHIEKRLLQSFPIMTGNYKSLLVMYVAL